MLKAFDTSIYFTLSAALLLSTLAADEKPSDDLTASIFGFGSNSKDMSQKAVKSEECKNGDNCKVQLEKCSPDISSQLLYFKHIEAKGIGYKKGYSTVGAFLTPYTMFADFLPFADLRGHVFNDGKFAANAGLGVKYLSNHPFIFGAGVYYDFRQVRKTHFNQVSLSLETLARRWEARLNGYLPVGSTKHTQTKSESVGYNFDHFAGHNLFYNETFFVKKRTEFAMKGADAEFGWHLLKPHEDYTLYAAAGPYYYNGERKHAWGGKVRVEGRVTTYVTLEVSDSYDNIFHNIVQGQVSINVPFGGKIQKKNGRFKTSCSTALSMEARMMRPMNRQEIIVAHSERKHFFKTVDPIAINPQGVPINIQFVNPNATGPGDGTFENPYALLTDAQAASQFGDIFYVYPGNISLTHPFVMIQEQSLLGSGNSHNVSVLVQPNQVATINIPAQTSAVPSITGNGGGNNPLIILNGNNNVISGFSIAQNNFGDIITNVNAVAFFEFKPIANVTINNNTITLNTAGGFNGIYLQSLSGNNQIGFNTFLGNTSAGCAILIDEENLTIGNVLINNNVVKSWGDDAIALLTNYFGSGSGSAHLTAILTQNTVSQTSNFSSGIVFSSHGASTIDATVFENISNNNTHDGIYLAAFDASSLNSNIHDNVFNLNKNDGIEFDPRNAATMGGVCLNNICSSNMNNGIGFPGGQTLTGSSFTETIFQNICSNNAHAGMGFFSNTATLAQMHFNISENILTGNGLSNGYNFYLDNPSGSTTCLKLTSNINDGIYGLENGSTANASFNLEPLVGNEGQVFLINPDSASFNMAEPGTCTP
ncbi:MAG: hypothetical protein JSS10_01375 [Verrucomicrobia bacterium]|nr:hypothetical protein [Verrucomicrobiota bacterium]